MAAKKSGTGKSKVSKAKKRSKKITKASGNDGNELSGGGLSLSDQARLNGKYEKFESIEERVKEVERVKRFIFANLGRTALGMMKSAEKGSNSAGAKLLWEFAEIDSLTSPLTAPVPMGSATVATGDAPVAEESAEEDDPTKAVLSFYKKLGIEPPKLKPPKAVEAESDEQPAAG